MAKIFIIIGSLNAILAIGFGAFGAHGLKNKLSTDMLAVYQTAAEYHMYHALGLILISLTTHWIDDSVLIKYSAWIMLAGIFFFSGSLYLLSITGIRWLGAITPVGGLCFIVSWLLVAISVWQKA